MSTLGETTEGGLDLIGSDRWALGANALTVARFFGAPLLAALVAVQNPWWLTFWFGLFLGATDYFDGKLARRATPTRLGAFLDPLADKMVVLLVSFVMVGIGRFHWVPIALITVREVALTVYRSYWGRRGLAIPARQSGKYKTLIQGLALAAALCPALDTTTLRWVADVLLWVAVAFTLVSGYQYFADGRSALRTTGTR